jgi:hypothetical protein
VGSSCNIANRIDYYIPSDAISKAKLNSQIFRALFKYGLSSFILLVLPIKNYTREALLEARPRSPSSDAAPPGWHDEGVP